MTTQGKTGTCPPVVPTVNGTAPTLDGLLGKAAEYLPADSVELIRSAYEFGERAHQGQYRKSGEAYIEHPLAAAYQLCELRLDSRAIAAALLHDVPEDCGISLETLRAEFGGEVAHLVDGVTKLSRISFQTRSKSPLLDTYDEAERHAENLRKMLLAMAEDIRVVLIKLADRLHNMRTLDALPVEKQRRIAAETLEIFAPLANRLGIWQFKWELEDLSFKYLNPERYQEIASLVASRRLARDRFLRDVIATLQAELTKAGIAADVKGRSKHIYSIYQKMEKYAAQGKDFNQIYDLVAVRILVEEVQDCYSALGVVHALWPPIPGQFDDYIATPKESMYQSLHTTVLAQGGKPLEVQIRTHEMHRISEFGVAAHWRYKEGSRRDQKFEEKVAWLRQLLEWQQELSGAREFVETVKTDVFRDRVYVYTPRGEIKDLPSGATPLDFAYRVHTDIGHRCVGAKVNGRLVALNTPLQNGDIVEILTTKNAKGPSRDWLNSNLGYVATSHAREKIRQWFKRQERAENIARGREQIDKELRRLGLSATDEEIVRVAKSERIDDVLAAIGYGELSAQQLALRLSGSDGAGPTHPELPVSAPREATVSSAIQVLGVGDLLTQLARCCNPVPGDEIIGYVTRSRGVSIHRANCPNMQRDDEPERQIPVDWGRARGELYPVSVRVEAHDRVGLLRDVTSVVSEERVNMTAAQTDTADHRATIRMTLEIAGVGQLSRLLGRLEGVRGVTNVQRDDEVTATLR